MAITDYQPYSNGIYVTSGVTTGNQQMVDYLKTHISAAQGASKPMDGNKPIVICGGASIEAKDMDEAQRIAEREAHAKSTDAYILKPFRRVSPKREVVSTDL